MVERVLFGPGGATEVTLASILTELEQKLETFPADFPDAAALAKLEAVRALLAGTLVVVDGHPDPQLDALTNTQLRAIDVNVADTGERQYLTKNLYVTATGDTTVIVPAAGKFIRVRKTQALNRPTATTAPYIAIRFGSQVPYWANFVIMTRQLFDGGVDEPLIVNLDEAGQVAVTILYEEI